MTPKVSEDEVLQTLRPDNLVLHSGFKGSSYRRFKFVKRLQGSRYKIIVHCADAFHRNHGENVFLWTPCGNTDIVVLAVGLFQEFND